MRRVYCMLLAVSFLLPFPVASRAASDEAGKLRGQNALSEYAPSDAFLSGDFVADEDDPAYIFGKVKDFVKSRSCPTSWLIEEGEKKRIEAKGQASGPVEYTLYLEEDCPGKVAYYVFVDRSQANAAQWMEWRKQFHKNKAEQQYGAAKAWLERAAQKGFSVDAELRFVEVGGELALKKPEEILMTDLKFQPIYDIKQDKEIAR